VLFNNWGVKLKLTDEEKGILDGKQGEGNRRAIELLFALGNVFKAERFINIDRAHVALSAQLGDTVFAEQLFEGGATCKITATTNPPWDVHYLSNYFSVNKEELSLVKRAMQVYTKIGAVLDYSCIPGLGSNVPRFGEHVAFSESSATPYINSVLGAKSNRESSISALAAAVIGKTPAYGLHFDCNRTGTILIRLEGLKLEKPFEWGMLGLYLGKIIGAEIPVLQLKPGVYPRDEDLLYLGAELNTSGAVAMYHIIGITPEAPTFQKAFKGNKPKYEIVVKEKDLDKIREKISSKGGKINLILLGCPHYTIRQIKEVATLLEGKKIAPGVAFWICTSFYALELAKRSGYFDIIRKAGGNLVADTCIDQPCWKTFETGLGVTDSPKCAYYRERRGQAFVIKDVNECIQAAITGGVE
jgi:cis-L-3-hydroxyproline dehydratase